MSEQKKYVPDREELPQVSARLYPPFIPIWLREGLRGLRGAPLSVLLVYISRADKRGFAWPSLGLLMKETGYGQKAVKQARALLVGMGLLVSIGQERKSGKFGRKIFTLSWISPSRGVKKNPR